MPATLCIWGTAFSIIIRKSAPKKIPNAVFSIPPILIAGEIKPKKLAESITPAANPRKASRTFSETFRIRKTVDAPRIVAAPAIKLAKVPISTIFIYNLSLNKSICDGHSSAFAKRLGCNLYPGRRLPSLVFIFVNHLNDF